jgi:hypothetical protein
VGPRAGLDERKISPPTGIRSLDRPARSQSLYRLSYPAHLGIIFVNNQLDAQFYFMYVYFYSIHVSASHVPIIRRINCINTISGICHSVYITVWCAGLNGHLYGVTYTRCRIDTINSPDDVHMAARNMYRIEINIHEEELCVKLVIYTDYCTYPSTNLNPVRICPQDFNTYGAFALLQHLKSVTISKENTRQCI